MFIPEREHSSFAVSGINFLCSEAQASVRFPFDLPCCMNDIFAQETLRPAIEGHWLRMRMVSLHRLELPERKAGV